MKTINILLIIGLPGSGKTYYAKTKSNELGLFLIDDFKTKEGDQRELLKTCIQKLQPCIVTDPWFVDEGYLEGFKNFFNNFAESININIEYSMTYFENNPIACIENIERRNDGRKVNNFISTFSKKYQPPIDCLPVFKP